MGALEQVDAAKLEVEVEVEVEVEALRDCDHDLVVTLYYPDADED